MDRLELIGSFMLIILVIMSLYSSDDDLKPLKNDHNDDDHHHHSYHDHYDNIDYYDHTHEDFDIIQKNIQNIHISGNNKVIKNIDSSCNIRINNNKIYVNDFQVNDSVYKDFKHKNKNYKIAKVIHQNCKVFVIRDENRLLKVFSKNN